MILQVLVLIAAQVIGPLGRGLLPLGLLLCLMIVFAERVVLPVLAGRPAASCLNQVQSVPDPEILRQDRLEELKGPRPVCQNMVHLQVDPAPVIINSVEQVSASLPVDRIQRGSVIPRHFCVEVALVKVIPEQSLFQNTAEMGKIPRRRCHCALKDLRVHLFFEFTGDPEHPGVRAASCGGHYFGRVIQLIPF